MRRQALTLIVSGVLAVVLAYVGLGLPVPYMRLVPGPVTDTLGTSSGKPLITIKGAPKVADTTGKLYLVTVGEYGGPGKDLPIGDVLSGWLSSSDAVVPVRVLYPPTVTAKQAAQQDADAMTASQEEAKVAALRYLGYQLKPGVDVASIESTSTAKGQLQVDDVIVGVDGKPVQNSQALLDVTKAHKVGDRITLDVDRYGKQLQVPVTLQQPPAGRTAPTIGISVVDSYAKPFEIDIALKDVGGPSAGMAFALGIVDKLSGGNLTGGRTIAGTGTIDADGNVGPIGGIQQKMAGARHNGATVFLVPKDNCAEALKAVPHGLRLVQVTTLTSAVDALKAIRDGTGNVPSCSAS